MENTKNILDSLSGYEGIIYDFDGTIATIDMDWQLLKNELALYVRDKKGHDVSFTPLDVKLQECKSLYGEVFYEELLSIIAHREKDSGLCEINTILVDYIRGSSQKQALFTMNTTDAIEHYVYQIFGGNPFDIIVTKNTCIKPKPSADDITIICKTWGLGHDVVVYVGNSDADRISGELAGIKTYIITI